MIRLDNPPSGSGSDAALAIDAYPHSFAKQTEYRQTDTVGRTCMGKGGLHDGICVNLSSRQKVNFNHHFSCPENPWWLNNHHFEAGKNREKRNRLFSGSSIQIDMKTVNDKN